MRVKQLFFLAGTRTLTTHKRNHAWRGTIDQSGDGLEIEAVSARSTPTWRGRPDGPTTRPAAGSLIVLKITFARTQAPRKGEEPPLRPKDDASPIKPRPLVRSPRCRRNGRAAWSNRSRW